MGDNREIIQIILRNFQTNLVKWLTYGIEYGQIIDYYHWN